jgi:hypothetical protein
MYMMGMDGGQMTMVGGQMNNNRSGIYVIIYVYIYICVCICVDVHTYLYKFVYMYVYIIPTNSNPTYRSGTAQ